MVGYEDSVLLKNFIPNYDIKNDYYFHAGETWDKNNHNMIDAIAFKTKRIGHGLNSCDNLVIIEELKKNDICIEVNPLSNLLLGYVRDLHWHPAK